MNPAGTEIIFIVNLFWNVYPSCYPSLSSNKYVNLYHYLKPERSFMALWRPLS